jgi:hypothetical protein
MQFLRCCEVGRMPYVFYPDLTLTGVDSAVKCLSSRSPNFERNGLARIETLPTLFPEFSMRVLVALWGPADHEGNGVVIGMASGRQFTASRAITPLHRHEYSIELLDGAVVDEAGNVTLKDGAHVYDVRILQERLRGHLLPKEWEALEYCIAMHEGRKGGPERVSLYSDLVGRLEGFTPPPLKQIMGYIRDCQARHGRPQTISIETLRSALRMIGKRCPRHGVYAAPTLIQEGRGDA